MFGGQNLLQIFETFFVSLAIEGQIKLKKKYSR